MTEARFGVTPEWVQEQASGIVPDADPEAGHAELDRIWQAVLEAIAADECEDPAATAHAALDALKRVPVRWYA